MSAVWSGAMTDGGGGDPWIVAVYATVVTFGTLMGVASVVKTGSAGRRVFLRTAATTVIYASLSGAPMASTAYNPRNALLLWLGGAVFTLVVVAAVAVYVLRTRGAVVDAVFVPTAFVASVVYTSGIRPLIEAGADEDAIRITGPACADIIIYTFAITAVFAIADVAAPTRVPVLSFTRTTAISISLFEQARVAALTLGDSTGGTPTCDYDVHRYLLLVAMAVLGWAGVNMWVAAFVVFYSHVCVVLARDAMGASTDGGVVVVSGVLFGLVVLAASVRAWAYTYVPFFLDIDGTKPVSWLAEDGRGPTAPDTAGALPDRRTQAF